MSNIDANNEHTMGVRIDGSSLSRFYQIHEAEAGGYNSITMPVKVHTNGLIECYTTSTSNIFYIMGYFSNADFTEEYSSSAISTTGAWTDLDLGTSGNVTHAVIIASNNQDASYTGGIRTNDGSVTRSLVIHEPEAGGYSGFMFYVNSDSSDVIEYYLSNGTNKICVDLGCFQNTVAFVDKMAQVNLTNTSIWEDVDISSHLDIDGRIASFLCTNFDSGNEINVGIRYHDSPYSLRYISTHESEEASGTGYNGHSVSVKSDASGIIQGYTSSPSYEYCYMTGYFKPVAGATFYERSTSLSLDISGSASRAWEASRSTSKAFDISESTSRKYEATRSTSLSLDISESTSRIYEFIRSVSNAFIIALSASRAWEASRSTSLSLGFSGSGARSWETSRSTNLSLDISESTSRSWETSRSTNLSLGFSGSGARGSSEFTRNPLMDFALGVDSTPTFYPNGTIPPEEEPESRRLFYIGLMLGMIAILPFILRRKD